MGVHHHQHGADDVAAMRNMRSLVAKRPARAATTNANVKVGTSNGPSSRALLRLYNLTLADRLAASASAMEEEEKVSPPPQPPLPPPSTTSSSSTPFITTGLRVVGSKRAWKQTRSFGRHYDTLGVCP